MPINKHTESWKESVMIETSHVVLRTTGGRRVDDGSKMDEEEWGPHTEMDGMKTMRARTLGARDVGT